MSVKILVIDNQSELKNQLEEYFSTNPSPRKVSVELTNNCLPALSHFADRRGRVQYELVFYHCTHKDSADFSLLSSIRESYPQIKIIMVSDEISIDKMREAMRRGAFDYIKFPLDFSDLSHLLSNIHSPIYNSVFQNITKKENARIKKQLAEIIYISQMISSILDINYLLEEILNRIMLITDAGRGAILLYGEDDDTLRCHLAMDKEKKRIQPFYSNPLIKQAIKKRDALHHTITEKPNPPLSVFCIPLEFEDSIIGILYLDGESEIVDFTSELSDLLKIFSAQASISIVNARKNEIIRKQLSDSMQILYSVIATNSSRVYEYSVEGGKYCRLLCEALGLSAYETERILFAVTIHDLSIVGFLENLFYSGKPLNDDERKLIERHPLRTVEIIDHLEGIKDIKEMILQHHERWDGTGYPQGLKKNKITLGARIIGLVDDFSFMLRMRQYQNDDRVEKIIQALKANSGKLYDPVILEKFIELILNHQLIYMVNESDIIENRTENRFEWRFPSSVNFEPIIVGRMMKIIDRLNIDEELSYFLDFSICEVIRNAIVHGNKYNQQKQVTVTLEIKPLDASSELIIIKVLDEGAWTEYHEHNRFTHSREAIFEIFSGFEKYMKNQALQEDIAYKPFVDKLRRFIENNYVDYHTFLKIDGNELSGGIGLFQVKKIFDHVEFESIVEKGAIRGTLVTLMKTVETHVRETNG